MIPAKTIHGKTSALRIDLLHGENTITTVFFVLNVVYLSDQRTVPATDSSVCIALQDGANRTIKIISIGKHVNHHATHITTNVITDLY